METYQFTVVIEPDEDAFHAFVPALPGCHTFGMTVDEARANVAEALELHIESIRQACAWRGHYPFDQGGEFKAHRRKL